MRKNTFNIHKFANSQELDKVLTLEISNDRSYVARVLMEIKLLLDSLHIIDYIDFIQIFNKFNIRRKVDQFLIGFEQYYNSSLDINNDQKILWLKKRVCRQSNSCEKNMFLTMLSHKYESKLLEYLKIFISQEIPEIEKQNLFCEEFTNRIKLVRNQVQNIENKIICETEMKDYYSDDYEMKDFYSDD